MKRREKTRKGPCFDKKLKLLADSLDKNSFLLPQKKTHKSITKGVKTAYDSLRSYDFRDLNVSGLPILHIDGFDCEQIWTQVEEYQSKSIERIENEINSLKDECREDDEESSFRLMKARTKLMLKGPDEEEDDEREEEQKEEDDDDHEEEEEKEEEEEESTNTIQPPPEVSTTKKPVQLFPTSKNNNPNELTGFEYSEEDDFDDKNLESVGRFIDRMEEDLEFMDDEEFNDAHLKELYGGMGVLNQKEEEEENEGEDDEEEKDDEEEEEKIEKKKSPFQIQQEKMLKEIEELEEKQIEEKSWKEKGEVNRFERPIDSLIDEDVNFRTQIKLKPIMFEKKTEDLESIIMNRIMDREFDDPEPYEQRDPRRTEEEDVILKQIKERRGLGEIYDQEYRKMILGEDINKSESEKIEYIKKKILIQMGNVMSVLNAMSSFNYVAPGSSSTAVDNHMEKEGNRIDKKSKRLVKNISKENITPFVHNGDVTEVDGKNIMKPIRKLQVGESEMTSKDKKRKRKREKEVFKKNKRRKLNSHKH